ncbi:hypothetical protein AXF42_Ash020673 [Apostasia shenzhenica]|uniref:Retrotransposon gag domain-containing protein n=1 Tax=Apostasia shenzhenica TaxID=1088818 RepID=A0A2H9ZW47_9ASPA|nr:hypothetical protein AXF42_Ash020673 [Apostasia shenzhenica]
MNSFLTNLPILLHQRPPLPLAPAPAPKDPVPPPSTAHNEPPPEEVSTHAVEESRLEVYPSAPQVTTIFSPTIMAAPVPRYYKAPKVNDYNRLIDPAQHVKRFENALATGDPVSDACKCRLFRNTLIGLALDWLDEIPQGFIQSFEQFADQIRHVKDYFQNHPRTLADKEAPKRIPEGVCGPLLEDECGDEGHHE